MRTLLKSIEEIPEKLKNVCDNRQDIYDKLKAYVGEKKIGKILIVGSGTSYNAALTTKMFGEKVLNVPVEIMYPNDFYHYYNKSFLTDDVLTIFISQTGSTKLVYDSLVLVKNLGLMNIAITENSDSAIAKEASLDLDMGTGIEEYVYRTIGYSTTCATMYLVYLNLLRVDKGISPEAYDGYILDFMKAVSSIEGITARTHIWYEKHAEAISSFNKFIFAGAADLLPVAMEADIKFMEMVPVFTNSFEMEELIHGPQNAFDESIGYFLISKSGVDSEKAGRIAAFIRGEIGENAILVGDVEACDMDIFIDYASENFYPLEAITALQVLAYRISVDRGRDLSVRINSSINNYITKLL
ncbi:SIS domain-containing protein [Gottschalkiaceae bacterium SANA]|nr:SIS domain-containing protein [Gottschalkiaceae bacterium SANA]